MANAISLNVLQQTDKYVAFLDVLGFKEMVSGNDERLNKYFEIVETRVKELETIKDKIQVLAISDSIVLHIEQTDDNLRMLLKAIQSVQTYLAYEDIWMRGAVSAGKLFSRRDPGIIVGSAFINAYELEKAALYPRVIIDPIILNILQVDRHHFYGMFNYVDETREMSYPLIHEYNQIPITPRITPDDAYFVNYAERIINECLQDHLTNQNHLKMAEVYKTIRARLYSSQRSYDKYRWLQQYFCELLQELAPRWPHINDPISLEFLQYWKNKFEGL